ncbi:hypothetical protein O3M35_000562 [Rhynocoris fuscipes]|uniref:Uncharacterized protein n=1 Tax=Rhynocoris fuscipes TaxID=488301 RepID=A0AAW1DQN6_9HEMI
MLANKEAPRLYAHIIKRSDDDFELAGLSEDKQLWCVLPTEHQNLKEHQVLMAKSSIKSAVSSIKPINGFRRVGVRIDADLKREYFDDDDNLCYKNFPLEESVISLENVSFSHNSQEEIFLIKRIKELETKLNLKEELKLHEIEKKFVLEKFDKTQNPAEWFAQFERECARHKVNNATNLIEALRFFLTGSPKIWYESNRWTVVRKAFNFKHLGGSLIDYALAKEKLCLEIEPTSTIFTRINMIVVGLPLEIQNELDNKGARKKRVEDKSEEKKNDKVKPGYSNSPRPKQNLSEVISKMPCFMCDSLGWPNRFHPTNVCRNKTLYASKKECNFIEAQNCSDDDAETMKIELDKKALN